jgi:hypothetical protein
MLQAGRELDLALETIGPSEAANSGSSTFKATGRSCLRSWAR